MGFKSKSQKKRFEELVKQGKMTQATLEKWLDETHDYDKLPEKVPSDNQVIETIKNVKKI